MALRILNMTQGDSYCTQARTPFLHWIWQCFVAFIFSITMTLFGTLIIAGVMPGIISGNQNAVNGGVCIIVALVIVILSLRYAITKDLRYIAVTDSRVRLGWLLFGYNYRPVDILSVDKTDYASLGNLHLYEIFVASGRSHHLWLHREDYRNIVAALQQICGDGIINPLSDDDKELANWMVTKSRRRRAVSLLVGFVFAIPTMIGLWQLGQSGFAPVQFVSILMSSIIWLGSWCVSWYASRQIVHPHQQISQMEQ